MSSWSSHDFSAKDEFHAEALEDLCSYEQNIVTIEHQRIEHSHSVFHVICLSVF